MCHDVSALQYAVQEGITLSKSDPAAKAFLKSLLDQLEIVSIPDDGYTGIFLDRATDEEGPCKRRSSDQ